MNGRHICLLALIWLLTLATPLWAGEWSGYVAGEYRGFFHSPAYEDQESGPGYSFSTEPEYYHEWDDGQQSFTFKPFFRWDSQDSRRTHGDIRELQWTRVFDSWEMTLGVSKVFWGVTEVQSLVDIINQVDLVEDVDREERLGQLMARFSWPRDWGTVDFFVLPGFRQPTYIGKEERLRLPLRVDKDEDEYESGAEDKHVDFALRWSQAIGDWDIGLAHFHGTSRDPELRPGPNSNGELVLIPRYSIIDQTSLDVQATKGDWLWKLEALHRGGQGESYFAATGGFEYTLVGIAETSSDLGVLMEFMFDERGDDSDRLLNHELFGGLRWTANDAQSTELLVGLTVDWEDESKMFLLEGSRRLGQDWKLTAESLIWFDTEDGSAMSFFDRDDYVQIELARYF